MTTDEELMRMNNEEFQRYTQIEKIKAKEKKKGLLELKKKKKRIWAARKGILKYKASIEKRKKERIEKLKKTVEGVHKLGGIGGGIFSTKGISEKGRLAYIKALVNQERVNVLAPSSSIIKREKIRPRFLG